MLRKPHPIILPVALMLLLMAPHLLARGMFMDGTIYAVLARNMAEGIGSFWHPIFSIAEPEGFFRHPPLALGIESLFFRLLGDHLWVERLFSLLTGGIMLFIIHKLWKNVAPKTSRQLSWWPMLLWGTIPLVSWGYCNNMLENVTTIFTTLAILFFIRYRQRHKYYLLAATGIATLAAIFSKGPVGLFPLALPLLYLLAHSHPLRGKNILDMLHETFIIISITLFPFIIGYILYSPMHFSVQQYIHDQLLHSYQYEITVPRHTYIIERALQELLPAIALTLLIIIIARRYKHTNPEKDSSPHHTALFFLLVALSATLPFMAGMKQSGFYLLPAFPLYAMAMALFSASPLSQTNTLLHNKLSHRITQLGFILIIPAAIIASINCNKICRDNIQHRDLAQILATVPPQTTITICRPLNTNWGLIANLNRYQHIAVQCSQHKKCEWYLTDNTLCSAPPDSTWQCVTPNNQRFMLWHH